MIVTTRHLFTIPGYSVRRGFCRGKSREWAERHGLNWRDFVQNGVDSEVLVATGDALAIALVKWAKQCEEGQHGQQ